MTETIKLTAEEKEFLGQHLGRIIDELMLPPKIKGGLSPEHVYALNTHITRLRKLYLTVTGDEWEYGGNKRNWFDASLV